MATFVLIHGAADTGWSWHLVEAELRARGHDVVAPDLPCDDDSAGLREYADTVADAVGGRTDLVVVGHSFGGFTAPLVAERLGADLLVFLAGMIPSPVESPGDWWENTGLGKAVQEQAERDGGLTGHEDPYVGFLHDVPRPLAEEALRRGRDQSSTPSFAPWPLDALPDVPTKAVICEDDRFFPAAFLRRVTAERLGVTPDVIPGGHCVTLSRPKELADLLTGYLPGA
ncbi:alpha/beta fold hydrolase [Actinomadura viridis]|uniref:Pimeloyl-ACP methyl ester carboxylesterase n=1 Tax=Actinomadura viridis TaxID=58110 RepID=A0A931DQX0_9ACTN|nr:alpha/beta hydrolase [Actinomadura viridis]MBG6092156.1 pimeloyl-ACP methyl ester carboxylesterase [Actinomadura viridis]